MLNMLHSGLILRKQQQQQHRSIAGFGLFLVSQSLLQYPSKPSVLRSYGLVSYSLPVSQPILASMASYSYPSFIYILS